MIIKKYEVVIACGGFGTRLKNITKDLPKPLYPVFGKSTLERCIEELLNHSIKNIVITVGYKSISFEEKINLINEKYNINIDIFFEEKPLGECGALWELKDKLLDDFIFINGDIIFSIDFKKLIYFHKRLNSNITLVTHTSDHPQDSDLISAPNGTLVENIFLKNMQEKNHRNAYLGNSGIFVIKKKILWMIPPPNKKEPKSIFHFIVKEIFNLKLNIYSYNTSEYIKDMGTNDRFKIVEYDLKENKVHKQNYQNTQKALFIDRDNTLIKCRLGSYILNKNEIVFIKENIIKLSSLAKEFNLVCLVTNQPSISMGKLTLEELDEINSIIVNFCLSVGLKIDVITFCPHHPHKGFLGEISLLKKDCFCRKPNPGMLFEQSFLRNIDLKKSLMVGDSENDKVAAKNAGCNFLNIDNL
jgi:D-glycero-D-manno-heptose 1,7-bisphosphate phosphatase